MNKRVILWSCLLVLLAACGGGEGESPTAAKPTLAPTTSPDEEVTEEPAVAEGTMVVTGTDRSFDAPSEAVAGPIVITFKNTGMYNHELVVARLPKAPSISEIAGMPKAKIAKLITELGHTPRVLSGETAKRLKLDLKPGSYGLFCLVDVGDGTTHAAAGMARPLTVD